MLNVEREDVTERDLSPAERRFSVKLCKRNILIGAAWVRLQLP